MMRNLRSFVAQAHRQSNLIGSRRSFCTQNVSVVPRVSPLEKVKKIRASSSFLTGVIVYGAYELYGFYQFFLKRLDEEVVIKRHNLEAVDALRGNGKLHK